jgi:cell division protein FtsB
MKLELAMRESDKKLLIFLGVFVVIVCFGYWGIRPNINQMIEINEQIADDEDIKMVYDMKLAELPMLQAENEKLEENIQTARDAYFPMMSSDEVDRYFTNMALSYNLQSYDLSITMPEESCTLEPYQYSAKALKTENTDEEYINVADTDDDTASDSSEALDDDTTSDFDSEEEELLDNGIYAVTVTLRLVGEQADLTRFAHDISNSDQKLRVKNYSYSTIQSVQTGTDGTYDVLERRILNVTIDLYMCEE